jgi:glycoprotease/Kae1 family metallohydrolase
MITLGIESTAHTFGCAILKDKKVLSNVWDAFTLESGGMIPAEVGKHHVDVCDAVITKALDKAGMSLSDVNLIAFSQGPGIGNALKIGALCARSLAVLHDVPLVGVNHCIAHLEIGGLIKPECKDPVLLYASGANTQVIAYDGGKYRVFGETLDMGVGNFLDSFGRLLDLGFPAGPKIELLARNGKMYIPLPYVVKGMDVSLGGLFTKVRHLIDAEKKKGSLNEQFVADLCFSVQETVFAMLVEVSERALAHVGKKELLLGGGVACNKRLQSMCESMCAERGCKSFALPNEFNVDNAAMIAWLGQVMFAAGLRMRIEDSAIRPYERTDAVHVVWR